MKLMLDTNRYKDLCSGEATILTAAEQSELIVFPFIVIAELKAGFLCGTKAKENEAILSRFLNEKYVQIIYADKETLSHYAVLYKQLREQGTPIPTNDLWIAALAVQHNMTLGSRDKHFKNLSQISLI